MTFELTNVDASSIEDAPLAAQNLLKESCSTRYLFGLETCSEAKIVVFGLDTDDNYTPVQIKSAHNSTWIDVQELVILRNKLSEVIRACRNEREEEDDPDPVSSVDPLPQLPGSDAIALELPEEGVALELGRLVLLPS